MDFIDDFEGNKLSRKWVATRYSFGGQNNGVWTREIKDSKIYAIPTSTGTESGFWGERFSLPVNAPGDITIKALIRQKRTSGAQSYLLVGIDDTTMNTKSCGLGLLGGATNYKTGFKVVGQTTFPGFPSKTEQISATDQLAELRIVRKNGYVFYYIDNLYIGQYAYANTIATVDIYFTWDQGALGVVEKWVDWIRVSPSSVVL